MKARSPLPIVLFHWFFVLALLGAFLTGLRVDADELNTLLPRALIALLPQGMVFYWHLLFGIVLAALSVGYLAMQFSGRGGQHLAIPADWRRRLASGGPNRWHTLNVLSYRVLLVALLVSAASGVSNYLLPTGSLSLQLERLHFMLAWFYPVFLVVHVIMHLANGGLRRLLAIFLPRLVSLRSGVFAVVVSGLLLAGATWIPAAVPLNLDIVVASEAPVIDGSPEDPAWETAPVLTVQTSNGVHLIDGATPVTLQALRDDEYVYFLFQWPDPTRSQKHLPLVKTQDGWRVVQTDFLRADENAYYEDKFAVAVADDPLAVLTSIHMGEQPLAGQPSSFSERGLHYTQGDSLMDLWHWKSVRGNPNDQADDNFFGSPQQAPPQDPRKFRKDRDGNYPRFTAGYRKDPPTSWNGYAMNWEVFKEGVIIPRRLPKDPDYLQVLGSQNLASEASDDGDWWMEWNDTKPYMKEHDRYSIGTILPGVLIKEPMGWDRGQVQASGSWREGVWRLEMKRKLDTGSKFDVPIQDGTYLWVAVFDHTQTRHSRHLRPVRLHLSAVPERLVQPPAG
ncbi:MAG: ethylbenzene dehydrogenase-related protein [Chromatiales bacterium]|jgi:cytochrome b561